MLTIIGYCSSPRLFSCCHGCRDFRGLVVFRLGFLNPDSTDLDIFLAARLAGPIAIFVERRNGMPGAKKQ